MDNEEVMQVIVDLTEANTNWRHKCINLIASENVMSPTAERLFSSDFMHRYAEGDPFKRYYQGTEYIDKIETLATDLMKKLFKAKNADVRPTSGTLANLALYTAVCKPGDTMLSNGTSEGGHISHDKIGAAGVRGLTTIHYPSNNWEIDIDATRKLAKEHKPKLILVGNSMYLFPTPLKEMREIADEHEAVLAYDGAHVLGLIAGGQFQDPLREGADVVTSSTHKTFPGPQGGLVLCNDDLVFKKMRRALFPGLVCNHHLHRLPSLALTALEMMEFGERYAKRTVENAQALAQALHEQGINVVAEDLGFTKSHQVVFETRELGDSAELAVNLEKANIVLNKNLLPGETVKNSQHPGGMRVGVQEMTRFGMGKSEMKDIAGFMKRILVKKEDPMAVAKDVIEFRKGYQNISYCFDDKEVIEWAK